jgi:hypothetical protein
MIYIREIKQRTVADFLREEYDITSLFTMKDYLNGKERTVEQLLKEIYKIIKPIKTWYGYFDMSTQKLTSLKGCPEIIIGDFDIQDNWLRPYSNFKGFPKEITGDIYCFDCMFQKKTYYPVMDYIEKLCKVGGKIYIGTN